MDNVFDNLSLDVEVEVSRASSYDYVKLWRNKTNWILVGYDEEASELYINVSRGAELMHYNNVTLPNREIDTIQRVAKEILIKSDVYKFHKLKEFVDG